MAQYASIVTAVRWAVRWVATAEAVGVSATSFKMFSSVAMFDDLPIDDQLWSMVCFVVIRDVGFNDSDVR